MKVEIPADLTGKSLYAFLVRHKKDIIADKKRLKREYYSPSAALDFGYRKDGAVKAAMPNELPDDVKRLNVKVVANTSMWCDTHMDVLGRDSAAKSIRERKGMIPHIHDHKWELDAEVGDVNDIYYQDVPLTQLGINRAGTAQCLIFDTDIIKQYNEKVFDKYKAGRVKQHSIGLSYVHIELAINDSDYEKEQDFWNKYINEIINREYVEEKGYFWYVSEYKLLENSAVLLGANILTPTLETNAKSTANEPPAGTQSQPPVDAFDLDEAIKTTKFL